MHIKPIALRAMIILAAIVAVAVSSWNYANRQSYEIRIGGICNVSSISTGWQKNTNRHDKPDNAR